MLLEGLRAMNDLLATPLPDTLQPHSLLTKPLAKC